MLKVGIIGFRGMVGTVLQQRMQEEKDLENCVVHYFSTSQAEQVITIDQQQHHIKDAFNFSALADMDILLVTQGSAYTMKVHPKLRQDGWCGYWIDAASYLRMASKSIIVLDPINQAAIQQGIERGTKDFIGSNCTVSLMLMALAGLVKQGLIKAIQATTYQAISGSGAKAITELHEQMAITSNLAADQEGIELANTIHENLKKPKSVPIEYTHAPLAMNLLPWIDQAMENGQSKEEWKGMVETNKILNSATPLLVDSTCVRIPALRCHSQSLFIELTETLALDTVQHIIESAHPWIEMIPNTQTDSLTKLNPIHTANELMIRVGRLRNTHRGKRYIQCFTVGDQLLWGAAEPLRRTLNIIKKAITDGKVSSITNAHHLELTEQESV